jgi:hypothetical protein
VSFFAWLEALPVSQAILTGIWLHPFLLVGHSVGMGVLVGIILMLDLRVLGYLGVIPVSIFGRLIGLGWAGLALNFVTGVLMFMAYAHTLAGNWTFQLKMVCILLGGVSIWMLRRSLRQVDGMQSEPVFSVNDKVLALVSLVFWVGAIALGRLIAYTAPEGV